jgi:hypothetical protein
LEKEGFIGLEEGCTYPTLMHFASESISKIKKEDRERDK